MELSKYPEPQPPLSTEARLRRLTRAAQAMALGVATHNRALETSFRGAPHVAGPAVDSFRAEIELALGHLGTLNQQPAAPKPVEPEPEPQPELLLTRQQRENKYWFVRKDGVVGAWHRHIVVGVATVGAGYMLLCAGISLLATLLTGSAYHQPLTVWGVFFVLTSGVVLGEYTYECDHEVNGPDQISVSK